MKTIDGKALRAAARFAAVKDVRGYLCVVHVYGRADGGANVMASDGCTMMWIEATGAGFADGERFAVPVGAAAKAAKGPTTLAEDRLGDAFVSCVPTADVLLHDVRAMFATQCGREWTRGAGGALDARYVARVGLAFDELREPKAKYGAPLIEHGTAAGADGPTMLATAGRDIRAMALVMPMRGDEAGADLPAVAGPVRTEKALTADAA